MSVAAPAVRVAAQRPGAPAQAWKPLQYFNLYRATLAGLFIALVYLDIAPRSLGIFDPTLFRSTAILYLLFSAGCSFAIRARWPAFDVQVVVQVFADIIAITLLMHASGGVNSGIGMLLVTVVAGGGILAPGRIAILFAAIASLAVLAQQLYAWVSHQFPGPNYPHAGMLGAAFFATAILAFVSASRIRASEALAARREVDLANLAQLNEHIIQRMQSGILAVDPEQRIRLVNRSAQRLLGPAAGGVGGRVRDISPGLADLLARWRREPERTSYLFRADATHPEVTVSFAGIGQAAAGGVLVFVEDASAMQQRAQQLKLASLGRLTASIAHEIRNPLGAISHAGELLGEAPHLTEGDQRLTGMIRENSRRVNAIIENVLQLSRRKPASPESFELEPWLHAFVSEYAANTGADAGRLAVRVDPPELRVRIDPSQLHQVVWNLCDNGLRHAGPDHGLELRAGVHEETERPYLDIIDHGPGITEEAAEHVFEPFFTTRADGTGLGLYIARELCEGNQASLDLVPSDRGCRFRITFAHPMRQGVTVP